MGENLTTEDATCDQEAMRASTVWMVLMSWGMAAQQPAGSGVSRATRAQPVEDWVLANQHLRVVLRSDNLTLSVEDLAAKETWGADPWESSAGRISLVGKGGEALSVSLGAAAQKEITAIPAGAGQSGYGLRLSLAKFRSRMGPVRADRNVDNALSVVLQVWLAQDRRS